MIANDEVDPQGPGISYQFRRLDAAIQGNDQGKTPFFRKIDALAGHAIPLSIAVRDIKVDQSRDIPFAEKLVHAGDSRRAVHVVVSVDQYLFLLAEGGKDTLDRLIHILHAPGIVQVFQPGHKKSRAQSKSSIP